MPIPKHHSHVVRTVSCPTCGHSQKVRFRYNEVQVTEICAACSKVVTFERVPLGAERWRAVRGP